MPPYDDEEITQLARRAFEDDEALDGSAASCGSYASLFLLLKGSGSGFVSAAHVAQCGICRQMLARMLVRRCPSLSVLRDCRETSSGFAEIPALGRHVNECRWCNLRLAFIAGAAAYRTQKHFLAMAALACVLLSIGGFWLTLERNRERNAEIAANRALTRREQTPKPPQVAETPPNPAKAVKDVHKPAPAEPTPLFATFTLFAQPERGDGEMNEINVPVKATQIRLKLHLTSNAYQRYRASLKDADGGEIFVRDAPPSGDGRTLAIDLPARVLPSGDFILTISGLDSRGVPQQTVEDYSIRIHTR